MLPIICNAHSSAFDVLAVYMGQLEKHWPGADSYVFADRLFGMGGKHKLLIYSAKDPHYLQWLKMLADFKSDWFIYVHEDYLLYGPPDVEALERYRNFLEVSQRFADGAKYSYVRLLKSGCTDLGEHNVAENLYRVPAGLANFSMQATIWYKPDFMAVMEAGKVKDVRDELEYSYAANELGIRGLYHYAGEPRRGHNHWDSSVFPYVATAINKGRWSFGEYPELLDILNPYHIDPDKRGVV